MKIEYDPGHDLLNIEFITDEAIAESVELDGVIIDYSKDGKLLPSRYLMQERGQQGIRST